jgi:hypothetical protein
MRNLTACVPSRLRSSLLSEREWKARTSASCLIKWTGYQFAIPLIVMRSLRKLLRASRDFIAPLSNFPERFSIPARTASAFGIATYSGTVYDYRGPFDFSLVDPGTFASIGGAGGQRGGILALPLEWKTEELSGAYV